MTLVLPPGTAAHELKPDVLPAVLKIAPPPFLDIATAFKQLNAVGDYALSLGAKSVLLEDMYVDRDHIEDHSVFYAKSLKTYSNRCRRLCFFQLSNYDLADVLFELLEQTRLSPPDYARLCRDFSDDYFVGFMIVRPLDGSPVGRTVLKPPKEVKVCCRPRTAAHLLGLELTVEGVPFQQQDVAVSACATTALWSSLQAASALEPIRGATPAQITALASRYSLPFGRPMPSEGLSTGQMCQAMDALGVAPSLLGIAKGQEPSQEFEDVRGCIHAALRSRIAPVLILQPQTGGLDLHAVCATGMTFTQRAIEPLKSVEDAVDMAGAIDSVLVHDDRTAPYLSCRLRDEPKPLLVFPDGDIWRIYQLLVPLHPKVRLSFLTLRRLALKLASQAFKSALLVDAPLKTQNVEFENWIQRGYDYVREAVRGARAEDLQDVIRLGQDLAFARYIAVVRLGGVAGSVDVILDTTATEKKMSVIAVVNNASDDPTTVRVAEDLCDLLKLPEQQLIRCH